MPRRRKPDPPPRRVRNTGSVARQPDGTFWAIPPKWADPGRKPRRGFETWKAAADWLDAECLRVRQGATPDPRMTLEQYLSVWYARTADSAGWAPSTRAGHRARLKPFAGLAQVKLTALTRGQCQDVIAQLARQGLSAAVICQSASLIRRALADAQDDGLVARNVAARLTLPKVRRSEPRAWTHAEARRLLDVIEGEPFEPVVGLGIVLGLRIGEILGLRWDDLSFDRARLTIQRSYSSGQVGPTKSRRDRTVQMPERLWSALLRHREQQAPGTVWVFPSPRETRQDHPISYTVVRQWLAHMIEMAGIRSLGTHALRHTSATAMLSHGVLPSNAAQQLGHANPGVTLGSYWSPTEGGQNPADVVLAWLDGDTKTGDTRHISDEPEPPLEGE